MKPPYYLLLLGLFLFCLSCDNAPEPPEIDYNKYPLDQQAFIAAAEGNAKILRETLAKGIDPNVVDKNGVPLLQIGLGPHGSNEAIKVLIEKGANVNQVSKYGNTALMEACMWVSQETIALLLEKGANPNAQNNDGETPLHRMGFAGKATVNCVRLLVEAGARLDLKRKNGETILQHFDSANANYKNEILDYLKSHGAS